MSDLTPERLNQIEQAVQKEFGDHMNAERQSGVDYETMPPGVRIERDAFLLIAEVKRQRAVIEQVRNICGSPEHLDPDHGGCEGWAEETLLAILDALGDEA